MAKQCLKHSYACIISSFTTYNNILFPEMKLHDIMYTHSCMIIPCFHDKNFTIAMCLACKRHQGHSLMNAGLPVSSHWHTGHPLSGFLRRTHPRVHLSKSGQVRTVIMIISCTTSSSKINMYYSQTHPIFSTIINIILGGCVRGVALFEVKP